MLPKKKRLNRNAVEEVVRYGRRYRGDLLDVVLLKGEGAGKASVSVPKKAAKLAVARHRIKRRIMHALRGAPLPSGGIFIIAKAKSLTATYNDIRAEVALLLRNIK